MGEPLFSFIIPCFHSEETINAAIGSIKDSVQSFCNYEILLIAENEIDSSFNVVDRRDAHIKCFYSRFPGVVANRNKGVKEAKGRYVYFLDSDDLLVTKDWESIIAFVTCNSDIDVFFGRTINFNEKAINEMSDLLYKKTNNPKILDNFFGNDRIVSYSYYSYIIKKDFLLTNDVFVDEKITNAEDYLFVGLLLTKKPIFMATEYIFNEYIKREGSLSNDRGVNSALSFVNSFNKLFNVLKGSYFLKSLDRFRYTFVNVHLDSGSLLSKKDKKIVLQKLKENNIKEDIKECHSCKKRTMYLLFGYKITWLIIKIVHKIKGIV